MFSQLSFSDYQKYAASAKRVAVYKEFANDCFTPISAYMGLFAEAKEGTILESGTPGASNGRFSYIGITPLAQFQSFQDKILISEKGQTEEISAAPFTALRAFINKQHCHCAHPLSGFAGGVVGSLAYDAVRLFEAIPDRHSDEFNLPDLIFRAYKTSINFDHQSHKIVIVTIVETSENQTEDYDNAIKEIDRVMTKISAANIPNRNFPTAVFTPSNVVADLDDASYIALVEKAKSYIKQGDIFQVVLSRSFKRNYSCSPFDIYRALRLHSPSPYMFYFDCGSYVITGASPEKLISVKKGVIETVPIAGTRPRGEGIDDELSAAELLQDEKENAEHMMLVDLARNDVGTVSKPNSINVPMLKTVQYFTHVMHMVSHVTGVLDDTKDVLDALQAILPAGTLSGAPKIRAMTIIDELEISRRGVYGGAICFIDHQGDLDSCITIRTAFLKEGVATVRAGAGIVYDSIPSSEAAETYHKAKTMLAAISLAEGEVL